MAERYILTCSINLPYSKKNIEIILKKAELLGCTFFLTELQGLDPSLYQKLSLNDALETVFLSKVNETMKVITIRYKKTFMELNFFERENMGIMFSGFCYPLLLN